MQYDDGYIAYLNGTEIARKNFTGTPDGDSSASTVVMGYCFGGAATLELARSGQAKGIAGYATFHGGLKTPEGQSYSGETAPILVYQGGATNEFQLSPKQPIGINGDFVRVQAPAATPK